VGACKSILSVDTSINHTDHAVQASPTQVLRNISRPFIARYKAWNYLFWGPQIIQEAFDEVGGRPFELFAPDNRYVFVSDPQQIRELDNAPDTVLSLQAASKQVICSFV
jgi:hypothetical protein